MINIANDWRIVVLRASSSRAVVQFSASSEEGRLMIWPKQDFLLKSACEDVVEIAERRDEVRDII